MSWSEIKATPSVELQGLAKAFDYHTTYHAFDGYSSKDINNMAKDKPNIRAQYEKTQKVKEKFDIKTGLKKKIVSLQGLV